jgi:hypothetical protein
MTNPGEESSHPPGPSYPPPGYPPPQYGAPPPGYPVPDPYLPGPPSGTNGKAIASLVTSILGWVCFAPLAIVGLILGVMAMRETKRTGQAGHGMALGGTIIGGLFVAAGVILVPLYLIFAASR